MKCKQCGAELQPDQKFCPECGQAVGNYCPNCGEPVKSGENFCSACGFKLINNAANVTTAKPAVENKAVTYYPYDKGKPNVFKGPLKKVIIVSLVIICSLIGSSIIANVGKGSISVGKFTGGNSSSKDLSTYIPLAREDIMSFIKKNQLEEIFPDSMYGNDDLAITLNENGNINEIVITTASYALYGMKVGNEFKLDEDGQNLTKHNYGFIGEYGERIVYGVMSGTDTPGGDRMIGITVDENFIITEIAYSSTGAQELINGTSDTYDFIEDDSIYQETIPYQETFTDNENKGDNVGSPDDFILPDSSQRYLTEADLVGLDSVALRLARNEIYARHGRSFETEDLKNYFNSKWWYHGYISQENFDDKVFNQYERANLDLIKTIEGIGSSQEINEAELLNVVYIYSDYNYDEILTNYSLYTGVVGTTIVTVNSYDNNKNLWICYDISDTALKSPYFLYDDYVVNSERVLEVGGMYTIVGVIIDNAIVEKKGIVIDCSVITDPAN